MASDTYKIAKLKAKEAESDRMERIAGAIGKGLLELLKNPLVAGLASLAGVTALGRVTNDKGEYIMSSATLRALRGLSVALPVYQASQGGTAGIVAGGVVGGIISGSTARPKANERSGFLVDPNAPADLNWQELKDRMWTAHDPYVYMP